MWAFSKLLLVITSPQKVQTLLLLRYFAEMDLNVFGWLVEDALSFIRRTSGWSSKEVRSLGKEAREWARGSNNGTNGASKGVRGASKEVRGASKEA